MLTVTLNPKKQSRLNKLASQAHKDKNFYGKWTTEEFLEEYKDPIKILSVQERIYKRE